MIDIIGYVLAGMWMVIALLFMFQNIRLRQLCDDAIKAAQVAQAGWDESIKQTNEAINIIEQLSK